MENLERDAKKIVEEEEKFLRYEWNRYDAILFFLVTLLTIESILTGSLQAFLGNMGNYEYLGVMMAGFFYTYGLTTPFSIAAFFILAQSLNPLLMAFIGSLSSIPSELIIYSLTRAETKDIMKNHKIRGFKIPIKKSGIIKKLSPLIAGLIIASPLPDELAAVFLGSENYGYRKFALLAFVFNFLGILFIVGLQRIL
ncbi:MAG: hypothetical protein V1678_03190 [Candidatus Aenigmatarchaeota archaeon]